MAQDVDGQEAFVAAEVAEAVDVRVAVDVMEFVEAVTRTGELWTEMFDEAVAAVVVSSGVIDLINSSAVRGFILTVGAAIGERRSKS